MASRSIRDELKNLQKNKNKAAKHASNVGATNNESDSDIIIENVQQNLLTMNHDTSDSEIDEQNLIQFQRSFTNKGAICLWNGGK